MIEILNNQPGMRTSDQLRKIASFLDEIKLFKKNVNEPS